MAAAGASPSASASASPSVPAHAPAAASMAHLAAATRMRRIRQELRMLVAAGYDVELQTPARGSAGPWLRIPLPQAAPESLYHAFAVTAIIRFPSNYPWSPPDVDLPGVWHPNVHYPGGRVCLSMLRDVDAWEPTLTLTTVLQALLWLLDHADTGDPYNMDAGAAWEDGHEVFARRATRMMRGMLRPDAGSASRVRSGSRTRAGRPRSSSRSRSRSRSRRDAEQAQPAAGHTRSPSSVTAVTNGE